MKIQARLALVIFNKSKPTSKRLFLGFLHLRFTSCKYPVQTASLLAVGESVLILAQSDRASSVHYVVNAMQTHIPLLPTESYSAETHRVPTVFFVFERKRKIIT